MCLEDDRKKVDKRIRNCGPIHKRIKNPDVPQPCKHHKNVWFLWRCKFYLHYSGGGYRRSIISSIEEIIANDWAEGGRGYEAGLLGGEWDSYVKNYSQGYQTWKYSIAWRTIYFYEECYQIMWFWMVSIPGQQTTYNILWNSNLCISLNLKRQVVWWKNWYLVIGYNDVRNVGRWKSIQNNKRRIIDKNSERWDKYTIICICFTGG